MRPGEGAAVEVMAGERPSPLAEKVKARDGLALLDLGVTRLDLRTGGEDRPDVIGGLVRQQSIAQLKQADTDGNGFVEEKEARTNNLLRRLFKTLDRDNDGKVTEKELNEYLDRARELQTRATAACVTLVLSDQSRGLFDLLDARAMLDSGCGRCARRSCWNSSTARARVTSPRLTSRAVMA
jgi:hypothetical protein